MIKYYPYKKINKPMYFMGFAPMQILGIIGGGLVLFVFLNIVLTPLLSIIAFIPVVYYVFKKGQKIYVEQSKGCPNYLDAMEIKSKSPSYLIDASNLFKHL